MKTSIIIPTYNEERMIENVINSVRPYGDEVMVVGAKRCTDDTIRIAKRMGVKVVIDNGIGKGDALRVGAKAAKGDIIVFIDADGSHIPRDIPKLVRPILKGEADMVIGSRFLGGSEELHGTFDKFLRMFFSMCIAQVINWRFTKEIADTQNGFRAIKRGVFLDLDTKARIFDIETEMIMKCYKKGYKILEVPSMELKRRYGKSGISLWRMGWIYAMRVFVNLF
jgi:glycosyltransferase involved in cell wall biosynthesis